MPTYTQTPTTLCGPQQSPGISQHHTPTHAISQRPSQKAHGCESQLTRHYQRSCLIC
ncbi:hypothetical protein BJY04DRAFT_197237 [Aspergillus karnatakaensis]|uniref:uncharacterized protein n=1 Tax=Aspergillus karnatakaensis TaxID=1810916 RepID=UPI003CCE520F